MRLSSTKNYYQILQVQEDARTEVIRSAVKTWRTIHHPDKNPRARERAEELSKQISEIEDILCDPAKRAEYDRQIKAKRRRPAPPRARDTLSVFLFPNHFAKTPFHTAFDEGLAALNLKRFGYAARHFQTCVSHSPHSAPAYYNLALAYEGLRRWGDAITAYDAALRISPDFGDASTQKASLWQRMLLTEGLNALFKG